MINHVGLCKKQKQMNLVFPHGTGNRLFYFVEDDTNLVIVSPQSFDGASKFVRNVQLVGVEEEKDSVHAFSEPLEHASEIIASIRSLLLTGKDAGRVDDADAFEHRRIHGGALKAVQESVAEFRKRTKLFLGIDDESVARNDTFRLAIHNSNKPISGGLRTNSDTYQENI